MADERKRQIAYKARINELIEGRYIEEEGWNPNYIETIDGKQISRINLIGTVVSKQTEEELNYKSLILDDATGKIAVRAFGDDRLFDNVEIGGAVLLIGRPRQYGNEKYILAEILRKIKNKDWIKVRALELDKQKFVREEITNNPLREEVKEEEIVENNAEKIIEVIKKLDKGEGADFEDVLKEINDEATIKSLLKEGEIFEIKPGKLKVLK